MRTAVFSIISPNYRHFARVLMDSVRRHHPDWERFVLLVGGDAKPVEEAFTTVSLEALQLPHARQFCFRYTVLELNTAVKPWMFSYLFARGYDRVVYLDPDIFVYSPLAELPDAFLTLTPHLTGFIGGDEQHPSERTILLAGVYNLGFLAVRRGPELERFLAWWQEKLEFQCLVDTAHGRFVDQRWMDLAPGLFPGVAILRHDGYNVAYWNLRQRTVRGQTVNGQPLRFFHFSGFDPASPDHLSRHDVLKLEDVADARHLAEDYRGLLRAAGYTAFRNTPYAFGSFVNGARITDAVRVSYRNSPELQAAAGDDPFRHPELFQQIREEARPISMARFGVRSYLVLSRARLLVRLIPRPLRTAMREFLLNRRDAPPRPPPPPPEAAALQAGLNVVGYLGRPTGVGESARLCERACIAAGIPSHAVDVDAMGGKARYRASIYHVNADQTPLVRHQHAGLFEGSAYNIGCWHWELPELPDPWIASARPLHELWAPSAFVQSAVSAKVSIPVVRMPHGVEIVELEPCSLQELGVPAGRFTFLCMFDRDSVLQRKNPMGAVDAFRRAFPEASNAALLIKTNRGLEELREELRGVPNVHFTDRLFSRAQVNGLIDACDAVVSLHRSEGFGLILAEAMALGKPVVATGWSGNMEFMNAGNSCPVAYELVELDRDYPPYQAGQSWAEPDVDHAAQLMRRLVEDEPWRVRIGQRAQATMRTEFSPEAAGRRYRRRLEHLGLLDARTIN